LFLLAGAICCVFIKRQPTPPSGASSEVTEPSTAAAG